MEKINLFDKKDVGKVVRHVESHGPDVQWCIDAKLLVHEKTPFQVMNLFENKTFGKFFTLDGWMQFNEKDEYIYQEMQVHTAFATNPSIKNVLVIGGGDGGIVREVLKYKGVKHVDWIDIDGKVVEVCKKYFPSSAHTDKRVNFMAIDGIDWVKKSKDGTYDFIAVDSTDPDDLNNDDLSAATLFTKEFYKNCNRILSAKGLLTCQGESPYYDMTIKNMKRSYLFLHQTFKKNYLCQYFMPSYPSGWWIAGFATKALDPLKADFKKWNALKIKTKFFNEDVHMASFKCESNYIKGLVKGLK